jgi:hypothetical protein
LIWSTGTAALFIVCCIIPHECESFQQQSLPSSFTTRTRITWKSFTTISSSALFYQEDDPARRRQNNNHHHRLNNNAPTAFTAAALGARGSGSGSDTSIISNEYDRDAEFYKRRNQEYYNSLNSNNNNDSIMNVMSIEEYYSGGGSSSTYGDYQRDERESVEETLNEVIKTSRSSFKNVENLTLGLLSRRPLVALGLFVLSLGMAAYLTGFFILDGYIDNMNPAVNDQVPYWDEPDVHTIMRRQ